MSLVIFWVKEEPYWQFPPSAKWSWVQIPAVAIFLLKSESGTALSYLSDKYFSTLECPDHFSFIVFISTMIIVILFKMAWELGHLDPEPIIIKVASLNCLSQMHQTVIFPALLGDWKDENIEDMDNNITIIPLTWRWIKKSKVRDTAAKEHIEALQTSKSRFL